MLKEIKKARSRFILAENAQPKTIALDYYDGLDLLVEISKSPYNTSEIDKLLDEGDRVEITAKLNTMSVLCMKITIADITIAGDR